MGKKYIYSIGSLTKKHGQREVLSNIWLAFYPGAKIGVLGRNGAGKSTLLRIMAGLDQEFDGEARLTDGFTAGYLPQEPQLDPTKDVWGNVEQAVAGRQPFGLGALSCPGRADKQQSMTHWRTIPS